MFKFVAILALAAVAVAKPGHLSTHSIIEPVVVGATVHSAPSAISHQSQTQYHSKTIVTPVVAPVVNSYVAAPVLHAAPVVHAAPVLHAAPILSHVHHASPLLNTVHAAPLVHSAQVLHAAPLVHSVHAAPISYGLHH